MSADDPLRGRRRFHRPIPQTSREATPAERKLWSFLRAGRLDGLKFRRQQRLGPFFADFVCQSTRLVVELDGVSHDGDMAVERDARRTAYMEREGYRVIRFANANVMGNVEDVIGAILKVLRSDSPSPFHAAAPRGPLPLPHGERSL